MTSQVPKEGFVLCVGAIRRKKKGLLVVLLVVSWRSRFGFVSLELLSVEFSSLRGLGCTTADDRRASWSDFSTIQIL